jgi:hypothetical protein
LSIIPQMKSSVLDREAKKVLPVDVPDAPSAASCPSPRAPADLPEFTLTSELSALGLLLFRELDAAFEPDEVVEGGGRARGMDGRSFDQVGGTHGRSEDGSCPRKQQSGV